MERWVNAQLDAKLDTIDLAQGGGLTPGYLYFCIRRAVKDRDVEALAALMAYPEAHQAIAKAWLGKRSRGAPRRISDERALLISAAEQVGWVHEIWKAAYGRWKRARDNKPHAADIVVNRFKDLGLSIKRTALESHIRKHGIRPFSPQ